MINDLVEKAKIASQEYMKLNQEQIDNIVNVEYNEDVVEKMVPIFNVVKQITIIIIPKCFPHKNAGISTHIVRNILIFRYISFFREFYVS